jgi:hypothetical protein
VQSRTAPLSIGAGPIPLSLHAIPPVCGELLILGKSVIRHTHDGALAASPDTSSLCAHASDMFPKTSPMENASAANGTSPKRKVRVVLADPVEASTGVI